MSRIGILPINVPAGVTVTVEADNLVTVKGPKGELSEKISRELAINNEDSVINISRPNNNYRVRGQHGLARTLIHNMIVGVTEGHTKTLEIQGVGYRAQQQGANLNLSLGFSHPVVVEGRPGITFEVVSDDKNRIQRIKISGISKYLVGQVAADIRKIRKPEPYKGKGVRYLGEVVKLKAGKRASAKK